MNERAIFINAIQKASEAERSAYLDGACGDDAEGAALGKRPLSGSKSSVRLPTQRHCPAGSGSSVTGTSSAARASCEVKGTIGCEKVSERRGTRSTSRERHSTPMTSTKATKSRLPETSWTASAPGGGAPSGR